MQRRSMRNLSRATWTASRSALGCFLICLAASSLAIDVGASKNQGGVTNAPYQTSNAPSLLSNPFKWIFGSPTSRAMQRVHAPPNFKVELSIEPQQYVPSTHAPLRLRMTVHNQGERKYILNFDTAQRHEFIIRNQAGQDVYRASRDKVFAQVTSATVVNRNEKLVFEEELFGETGGAALQLSPGVYTLIGQLTAKQTVSAERTFQVAP